MFIKLIESDPRQAPMQNQIIINTDQVEHVDDENLPNGFTRVGMTSGREHIVQASLDQVSRFLGGGDKQ
jgi:hypothetical protein